MSLPTSSPKQFEKQLTLARNSHMQGNLEHAEQLYQQLLTHGENATVYYLLGTLKAQKQQFADAQSWLSKAVSLNPGLHEAQSNLGLLYEQQNQLDQAATCYQRALQKQPKNATYLGNLADIENKLGHTEQAITLFKKALQLEPKNIQNLVNYAIVLFGANKEQDAEKLFRQVLILQPNNVKALNNLGALLHSRLDYEHAIPVLRKAISLNPHYAEAYNNLGVALTKMGQLDDAEAALTKAISINQNYAEALNNLGYLFHEKAEIPQALALHSRALALNPNLADAHWYRGFAYLFLGEWAKGWDDYLWGLKIGKHALHRFPYPLWQGEDLNDKTVLIHAEQGIGDEIMFGSCIPDVLRQRTRCIIDCEPRLAPLFARSFPEAIVHGVKQGDPTDWVKQYEPVDYKIPMGLLPTRFRRSARDFPGTAYLKTDPEKIHRWQERYSALGAGLKIGISWLGGTKRDSYKRKTELSDWLTILKMPDCHFVNLQYGIGFEYLDKFKTQHGITVHHWQDSNPLADQDDFAAQMQALDLVISVGNATVHLAGACGINAWCLLPYVPSWRWQLTGERVAWYNSITLYRQQSLNNWQEVYQKIAIDLHDFSSKPQ